MESEWRTIIEMRRLGEPDDTRAIQDPDRLRDMFDGMNEWMENELAEEQKQSYGYFSLHLFGKCYILYYVFDHSVFVSFMSKPDVKNIIKIVKIAKS